MERVIFVELFFLKKKNYSFKNTLKPIGIYFGRKETHCSTFHVYGTWASLDIKEQMGPLIMMYILFDKLDWKL